MRFLVLGVALAIFLSVAIAAIVNANEKDTNTFCQELSNKEKPSPSDRIKDADFSSINNKTTINLNSAKLRKYIDSNSMDPLIDEGTTTIEITPKKESEIKIGDIISYKIAGYDYALVHRVVAIGNDEDGIYFVTKGDNYYKEDPYRVRFSQVEGIVVGILY